MLCDKYQRLVPKEKSNFIGELLHAVQSDDDFFDLAEEIIQLAYRRGLFNGVIINPPKPTNDHDES